MTSQGIGGVAGPGTDPGQHGEQSGSAAEQAGVHGELHPQPAKDHR